MQFAYLPVAVAIASVSAVAFAQPVVVNVNVGETLTPADLAAGTFGGQAFTLGPDTIFNINDGSTLGAGSIDVFDFGGSSVNIFGATLRYFSLEFRNAVLRIDGGDELALAGLPIAILFDLGCDVVIESGVFGTILEVAANAQVTVNGGAFDEVSLLRRFTSSPPGPTPPRLTVGGGNFASLIMPGTGEIGFQVTEVEGLSFTQTMQAYTATPFQQIVEVVLADGSPFRIAFGGSADAGAPDDADAWIGAGEEMFLIAASVTPVVDVQSLITDYQLETGEFDGQSFVLTPDTTINVHGAEGAIEPIGFEGRYRDDFSQYFDFNGATVNLFDGGRLLTPSWVQDGVLNVRQGGLVDGALSMAEGFEVSLEGGVIDGPLVVDRNATFSIVEGDFADLEARYQASVKIRADEAAINGVPVGTGAMEGPARDDVLTWINEDGRPYLMNESAGHEFSPFASLIIDPVSAPLPASTPMVADGVAAPVRGLRPDESLTLRNGGSAERGFVALDAELIIESGSVGPRLHTHGSHVELHDGSIAESWVALGAGGSIVATGGVARSLHVVGGSAAISGGVIAPAAPLALEEGATLELRGAEFKLDGVDISALPEGGLEQGKLLTGVLQDGSPFVANAGDAVERVRDVLPAGSTTLALTTVPPATPASITVPTDPTPRWLRAGQSLAVLEGGALADGFLAVGGEIDVVGGEIGDGAEFVGTTLIIEDGGLGDDLFVHAGAVVEADTTAIGDRFTMSDATARLNDVDIGADAHIRGSVTMTAGSIGPRATIVGAETVVEIHQNGLLGEGTYVDDAHLVLHGGAARSIFIDSGATLTIMATEVTRQDLSFPFPLTEPVELDLSSPVVVNRPPAYCEDITADDCDHLNYSRYSVVFADGSTRQLRVTSEYHHWRDVGFGTFVRGTLRFVRAASGCSPADLAAPFDALDIADVMAFLSAFEANSETADLGSPIGVWDIGDIVAFLQEFGAGCPS
ncbi:MAG: hypothetical protein CMJ31_00160 [Phycisphaerae bacterium]|nr:hypothetical protein [Phycisphaerae bacterium]